MQHQRDVEDHRYTKCSENARDFWYNLQKVLFVVGNLTEAMLLEHDTGPGCSKGGQCYPVDKC